MKKSLEEYTDREIKKRLDFAAYLEESCRAHGKSSLPKHLEDEKQALLKEQARRVSTINGEGI
jgi:hypothetical protein